MSENLETVREEFFQTVGRITSFWGFSKVMGQIYGLLYLSSKPMSLDDIAQGLSISKGNASMNVRALARWNMVRSVWVKGDRKDYFEAETDFWAIVRGVLRERDKKEFDHALRSISALVEKVRVSKTARRTDKEFALQRLAALEDFIGSMDRLVNVILALDDLKRSVFKLPGKTVGRS